MTQPTVTLFRRLMREAKQMNDYNFRAYAIRRVRGGFDKNSLLEGYVPHHTIPYHSLSVLTYIMIYIYIYIVRLVCLMLIQQQITITERLMFVVCGIF